MVIIFQRGNEFWIEYIACTLALTDAAGQVTGTAVDLEREGFFIGGSMSCYTAAVNDNCQAMGELEIRGLPNGTLSFGTRVAQIRARCQKQAGTDGNVTVSLAGMVFMRGRK